MAQGKPKDHYVPQFYLDAFAIEGPGMKNPHIYQYMENKIVASRISDVASEKIFIRLKKKIQVIQLEMQIIYLLTWKELLLVLLRR